MRQGNQKTYVCVVCCEREIKIIELTYQGHFISSVLLFFCSCCSCYCCSIGYFLCFLLCCLFLSSYFMRRVVFSLMVFVLFCRTNQILCFLLCTFSD